jgi:UDPglucose--hexose-1-phosphate uridylyltransferase
VPEVRIDPLTGQRAIVAGARAGRPGGELSAAPPPMLDPEDDPFAMGHEDRTPPELYAVRPNGGAPNGPGWTVRVVPNLYPALDGAEAQRAGAPGGAAAGAAAGAVAGSESRAAAGSAPPRAAPPPEALSRQANPDLFWAMPATGAHEVIVNAPDPVVSLADLTVDKVTAAVEVWRERMRAHADASYVHLIVNERREAGASLPHTHAQLYAMEFVPADIARERERFSAYATRTMGGNLLADLVQEEVRQRERIVAIDEDTVLMAPYAARVPYQLLIAPRRPRMRYEDDGPTGAPMLWDALRRLGRQLGSVPPLNLWVRTAPQGAEHFCWRIDILPRLTHLAGLELGAGLHLNIVAPEQAAAELRDH